MTKEKLASLVLAGAMTLSSGSFLAGCHSQPVDEGGNPTTYIVIYENGKNVLHSCSNLSYGDMLYVDTACCDSRIRTMFFKTIIYHKNKPNEYAYDMACPGME